MWHKVAEVATKRHLDPEELVKFAFENEDRFGIVAEYGYPEVNTWHLDGLIQAYKETHHVLV